MLKRITLALLGAVSFSAAAKADITETLYYTTFGGGENVWKVTGSYNGNGTVGNGTFSLTGDTGIAATPGADGIVLNPNNGQLLVGGQGNAIFQVNPTTGTFTSAAPNMSAFEITVDPGKNVVWAGGQEGNDFRISSTPINPFGAAGTTKLLFGSVAKITHITFVPGMAAGMAFYTSANDDGTSPHFGTINLLTGLTNDINLNAPAGTTWHGMDYDPFTGDLILAGGDEVLQVDPTTHQIVSTLIQSGRDFDQGAVDGTGRLFWADNNGDLLFLDYSTTGKIGDANNFVYDSFFKTALDDFAPLIGAGGTGTNTVPEPSSLLLLIAGLFGLGYLYRRKERLA